MRKLLTMPMMMTPTTIWAMIAITLVIGWCPPQSWAMLAPAVANEMGADAGRVADLQVVQRALESKLVQQRLLDFGLTADEVQARLGKMSNDDVHQLAMQIDSIMPGGDPSGVGLVIAVIVIVILIVILVWLLNHKIAIEKQ
jgi:hypothetical protein